MKSLKKVMAIVVVVAMALSLVSFSAFADESVIVDIESSAATIKQGGEFTLNIYYSKATKTKLGAHGFIITYPTGVTVTDVTAADAVYGEDNDPATINSTTRLIKLGATSKVDVSSDKLLVASYKCSVPSDFTSATLNFTISGDEFQDKDGNVLTSTFNIAEVEVKEGFTATKGEYVGDTSFAVGTDVAAELAKGTVTVKSADDVKSETGRSATWTAPAGFDNTKPGTYTFTGVVTPDSTKAAEWTGDLNVTAEVTLTALTSGTVTLDPAVTTTTVMQKADKTAFTADEVKAAVEAAIADSAIKVTNGSNVNDVYETATVTGTATADGEVGTTATATVTVTGASKDGKFNLAETTVATITVTVVPAEITDPGEVAVALSTNSVTSKTTDMTVKVTRKDERKNETGAVTVTIVEVKTDAEGNKTEEVLYTKAGTFEAEATELSIPMDDQAFITLMSKLEVGQELAVRVAYDGAEVFATTAKEPISVPVVNAPSSSGGSHTGIPTNRPVIAATQYDITAAECENGSISVSAKAAKDDTVKVTATPAEGYKLDKITVETKDGAAVTVAEDNTFKMPASAVTVSATFVVDDGSTVEPPVVDPNADFTDVASTDWSYEAIMALKELGIVNGVTATTFNPNGNVTRAEFTKMVATLFGLKATATESQFKDCGASDWFTPFVIAAAEAGYVQGVEADEFAPDAQITREDICTILGRVLNAEADNAASFADADEIAEYAAPYVNAFVALGVVKGYEDGTFAPKANATRAEAAQVIYGVTKLDNDTVKAAVEALKAE